MSRSSQKQKPDIPSPKKQRSILEYTKSSTKLQQSDTVVDLTDDCEVITIVKDEESSVSSLAFGEFIDETILCPICSCDISRLSIDSRSSHVELCLTRVSTTDTVIIANNDNSKKRKVKRELSVNEKEKLRYVNVENEESVQAKVVKAPTTIAPSKAKKPIPILKRMRFPITNNEVYEVAVDAFCYAPDDLIDKYFLTHFHSDHYGGISKKWSYERVFTDSTDYQDDSKYRSIIYCTPITSRLLTLYFSIDPRFIKELELDHRYLVHSYSYDTPQESHLSTDSEAELEPGLYVTPLTANHCPGAAIFLFESVSCERKHHRILHCGDFRVNMDILGHPLLSPYRLDGALQLDKVYLDTTYMSPKYNFPKQEVVCESVADLFYNIIHEDDSSWFGALKQTRITDFWKHKTTTTKKKKLLVLVGTYVIGKEKLAMAISKRLNCQIYASNINSRENKHQVLKTYDDEYLNSVLSVTDLGSDDTQSQCMVHLVPMSIVGSITELANYFNHNKYYDHFERCVGLRPTGWTFSSEYSNANDDFDIIDKAGNTSLAQLAEVMISSPQFTYQDDILPQNSNVNRKGKPDQSLYRIYSVPYSEHSSYRELAYFSILFNIDKLIPTVNLHSTESIRAMEDIFQVWETARKVKKEEISTTEVEGVTESFNQISIDTF
ncbi:beta-lactamase-like protein [Scheffersomyces amazonensis]|uniref:beta-lactamase-like protein n=1 Tax=Scheffersomyces amazonensis TaxID=1078765 RepID=UPI00315DE9B6